jgi:hypothetical protein
MQLRTVWAVVVATIGAYLLLLWPSLTGQAVNWRESYVLMVGRDLCRGEGTLWLPRVDTVAEGPGTTGMEFPLLNRAAAAKPSRTGATGSTYPSHSPRQPSGTGMREVSRGSRASTTSLSEPPFPSCFEPGRAPISTGASSFSSSSTVTRSLSSRPLRSVASSPAGEEPPYGSARWHSVQSPSSSSPGTLRHGTSPMASSRSLLSRSQHQWAFSAC